MKKRLARLLGLLMVLGLLAACSNTSSNGGTPPTDGGSNWDEIVWDQDNWA